jgi:hypothetical protein
MVTKSPIVVQPGGVPARAKVKPAAAGLALINEVLDADLVRAMVDSDRFRREIQHEEASHMAFDHAVAVHRSWLPNIVRAAQSYDLLVSIVFMPRSEVTPADASAMLHYLFGAMGKRRNDEAAAKLLACVDIFSPMSNALGSALGLWEEVPKHPAILAIAIKQLMAAKTFEPAEAELREALQGVRQRLTVQKEWVWRWLVKLDQIDRWVFEDDRAAWDAVYARASSSVALQMHERAELGGEGPSEDLDDDGKPEYPAGPRWLALNALWEAKHEAEEAAEQAQLAGPPERKRVAAAKKRSETKRSSIKAVEEAR